jgi:putative MATE family efflux protein
MSERIGELMKNPRRGLFTLAGPIMVSMFFSMLLNFVDFFFVGGLGPNALAGLQISFPLFFALIAIGSGVGIGTTSLIARRLGERNKKWAEETALHGLLLAMVIAILPTSMALFAGPLSSNLGGGPEASLFAAQYMQIILAGSLVFFLVFSMQSILQGEGDTKTPMKLAIVFTVSNIILDPIFIYTLGMGVQGAALATVLSEGIALALYFWHIIFSKRSYLKIKPREFIYTPQIIKNILKVGFPATVAQIGLSIAVGGVNAILSGFGDPAISAYGIGFRVDSLAILPLLGLGAGVVPMVGYFRGAKDYPGARRVYRLALKIGMAFALATGVLIFLLAGVLPRIFTSDPGILGMASDYLRVVAFAYPFIGMAIILSSAFQGMGKGMPSLIITMTRAILVVIPVAYYLAYRTDLGVLGVWVGITVSAVFSGTAAFAWIEDYFRKICPRHHETGAA